MKKSNVLVLISSLLLVTSCSSSFNSKVEFKSIDVKLDYKNPTLVELPKPTKLDSMDDYASFLDYVVFTSQNDEYIYTEVSDAYKTKLEENADYEFRWAGQYGNLSHNFILGYDSSKLQENLIGGIGSIIKDYATKKNTLNDYDYDVYDYFYYVDTLNQDNNRNFDFEDFELSKNNKGYIKVDNSEELFYVTTLGYMPYIENNEHLERILSHTLGILNRIIKEDMNELEKYEAIYSYLTNSVYYDYKMLHNKEGNPRLYRCYYLEGALLDNLAVCDGLTKAMALMCALEGIETTHIGAVGYAGGHAYNYTKIDDKYYLSCITNGSRINNYKKTKMLNHTKLFFLSDLKPTPEWDFDSDSHLDLASKITSKYDYWSNKYVDIGKEKLSLNIKTKEQGLKILEHVDKLAKKNKVSLDIELLASFDINKEMLDSAKFTNDFSYSNQGVFEGKKLYNYTFLGGELNEKD